MANDAVFHDGDKRQRGTLFGTQSVDEIGLGSRRKSFEMNSANGRAMGDLFAADFHYIAHAAMAYTRARPST